MSAIFGVLELEGVVQVGDKTRLSAVKSFVTKDSPNIVKVEIKPEGTGAYIDVTGSSYVDWFLDWVYGGDTRDVTVSVKVTTVIADPGAMPDPIVEVSQEFTKLIKVISVADDKLFSSDSDLAELEPDILKWVEDGRATWLRQHRASQEKILDWLNKAGVVDVHNNALTKDAIVAIQEVRWWSRDWTLATIFSGISNAVGDVFFVKSAYYQKEADKGAQRAKLHLDLDGDGDADALDESVNFMTRDLVRD